MTASSSDSSRSRMAVYALIVIFLLSAIAVVVLGTLIVSDRLFGNEEASTDVTSGVTILLSTSDDEIAVDRYFKLNVLINNDSNEPFSVDQGLCSPKFDIWIDGELRVSPASDCEQDRQDVPPGELTLVFETFDLSELGVGSHSFVVESSGVRSNTLMVNVGPATSTDVDCYSVIDRLMPTCGHVQITGFPLPEVQQGAELCQYILSQLLPQNGLQPVEPRSTMDCNGVEYFYFDVNVEPDELEIVIQRLDRYTVEGLGVLGAWKLEYPKL